MRRQIRVRHLLLLLRELSSKRGVQDTNEKNKSNYIVNNEDAINCGEETEANNQNRANRFYDPYQKSRNSITSSISLENFKQNYKKNLICIPVRNTYDIMSCIRLQINAHRKRI